MPLQVKTGEIDRDNNPVRDPETIATFEDRSAAEAFIQGKIAEFDHNGFVPMAIRRGGGGATIATASRNFISGSRVTAAKRRQARPWMFPSRSGTSSIAGCPDGQPGQAQDEECFISSGT